MRRALMLLAFLVGSFAAGAGAVAYFADAEQTNESVQAGPPIPWLRMWSQSTDPVNTDATTANNLTYATKNNTTSSPVAATGKLDPPGASTLAIDLGKPDNSQPEFKSTGNRPTADEIANVHDRFNRLFTVEVPSNAPLSAGQKVRVTLGQTLATPALSSSDVMFQTLEFATITAGANTELTTAFRGTSITPTTIELAAGAKRQVNVEMNAFGSTTVTSGRFVTTTILVTVATPDGGQLDYEVPVTICNHHQRCA